MGTFCKVALRNMGRTIPWRTVYIVTLMNMGRIGWGTLTLMLMTRSMRMVMHRRLCVPRILQEHVVVVLWTTLHGELLSCATASPVASNCCARID